MAREVKNDLPSKNQAGPRKGANGAYGGRGKDAKKEFNRLHREDDNKQRKCLRTNE